MKLIQSLIVFVTFVTCSAQVLAQNSTTSNPTSYSNYGSQATTPAQPALPYPASNSSFPYFPSNPAQSLLPAWSVGNTGSTSYSGSGMNGSYSGTSTFGNTYNSSGYNFPNQSGSCGVSLYADAIGGKSGANSLSSSADLNTNAMAARVGVSISSQPCLDFGQIEKQRSTTEISKAKVQEEGLTKRRCVEAITETGKLPITPQSQKAMENLMIICAPLMKG
ncbi:MAG: hypothetical protein H7196_01010 [candidate division SR1 bacterium]|nr:hypothetical protein [candidate division SR1 bacterium]